MNKEIRNSKPPMTILQKFINAICESGVLDQLA